MIIPLPRKGRFCDTWIGLDFCNDDTHPSGHINHPTHVNVSRSCFHSLNKLVKPDYIIEELYRMSDPPLLRILLCKSQELCRREYSMRQLCNIRHNIPVTLPTPWAYGQLSVFNHNGDKQLAVLGTRYKTWLSWYWQFEVESLQPLQLWLSAGISSVLPVLVSRDRGLCRVQLHPTWFEPTAECRIWPVAWNLYSGPLPVGLCLGQCYLLLIDPLFHFPQCHIGLVSSRNENLCPCHSITRAGFIKWQMKGLSVTSPSIACKPDIETTTLWWTGPMGQ